MASDFLRDFLFTVMETGAGTISKKRLIRWTGRTNDTPAVWSIVIREWTDIGGDPHNLYGHETFSGLLILVSSKEIAEFQSVKEDWSD